MLLSERGLSFSAFPELALAGGKFEDFTFAEFTFEGLALAGFTFEGFSVGEPVLLAVFTCAYETLARGACFLRIRWRLTRSVRID